MEKMRKANSPNFGADSLAAGDRLFSAVLF